MSAQATVASLPADHEVNISSLVETLAEDANGAHVYNNERAILGYVSVAEQLCILPGVTYHEPPALDLVELGSQAAYTVNLGQAGDAWRQANPYIVADKNVFSPLIRTKLIIANARSLMSGTEALPVERAVFIAMLRVRWLFTGCLFDTIAKRAVTHNEVKVLDATDNLVSDVDLKAIYLRGDRTVNSIIDFLATPDGLSMSNFVVNNAENIWNIAELTVRTRGHHYKDEYKTFVNTAYKSSSTGNAAWPAKYEHVDAFRTAIHPFGIKALPIIAYKNIWHGKVGNGLIKRITGASNGFACVTTAYAGFAMIATELWFSKWAAAYSDQITLVTSFARTMLDDRYSFHESAALYGLAPRRSITLDGRLYTMTEVEAAVSTVAPVLQGFILWAKSEIKKGVEIPFSFGNAMVLSKRSELNPMIVTKLKALMDATLMNIANAETTAMAIAETFPAITNEEA